jgi:hypothetical protein
MGIIRSGFLGKFDLDKGIELFEEAEKEMSKIGDGNDPGIIIDLLTEAPDWVYSQIEKLAQADKHFYQAIPGHRFPPSEQIKAGAEIIFGKEWTSGHSVRYWLKAIQM